MPNRILLVTVGGSDQPLVSSIERNHPDYVYFICSADQNGQIGSFKTVDGDGTPCGEDRICKECRHNSGSKRKSIVAQTGLQKDQYETILIDDPDDLNECYLKTCNIFKTIRSKNPATEIIADYTGGTKSMSSGLAAAVMDDGEAKICIVRGIRKNLHVVEDGTQSARLIDNNKIFIQKKLSLIELLWAKYDYQSCISVIDNIFSSRPTDPETTKRLDKILNICKGFEAWDRFDHLGASSYLKKYEKLLTQHIYFLGQIKCVRDNWPDHIEESKTLDNKLKIDKMSKETRMKVFSFTPVIDLILNARRRAFQGRYDDAVARLYRALEMFAQLNLLHWEKPLFSSDLELNYLPDKIKSKYVNLKNPPSEIVTIGLMQSFTLLHELETAVGKAFNNHNKKLRFMLEKRNRSLMAHGINPVSKEDYNFISLQFNNFIYESLQALSMSQPDFDSLQFPLDLLDRTENG